MNPQRAETRPLLAIFMHVLLFLRRAQIRNDLQQRRRRAVITALVRQRQFCQHPSRYCRINCHVPVLAMYFDDQNDLLPDFRLSRNTIGRLIHILRSPVDHGWGLEMEVLVCLFWLASATSYQVVSRAFSIPRSTVHDLVHRFIDRIINIKNRIIYLPLPEDLPTIGAGFQTLAGSAAFASVVGSIDGCHLRIKPPSEDAQCYYNRKGFHSIIMQAVCDHQCLFLDIFVGYPGSVHNSRVLNNSPLYVQSLYPPEGYCILGDGGYACISEPVALVSPYREPVQGAVAARFNRHHARARCVIERAFGILKSRWRSIFLKALEVNPIFSVKVIVCCAILHNFCLRNGETLEPSEDAMDPEDDNCQTQPDMQGGAQLREHMAGILSAPQD